MTLPTENPTAFFVGENNEGGDVGRGIAVLDSDRYRDMRWCANCGGEQVFVPVYEFEGGRVGVCLGCGDERVARFSRVTTEVA
jgi:hypothetical protein